ncbi:MAG: hydrogenase maturation nickel metallochaperone HypA [Deltaproteobacteria bacterium]|nr:MAG: hydrogenase maturation nickel metallochaperone HypA [Deltaproteobacteria bacterium]
MHEVSIAQSLIQILEDEMGQFENAHLKSVRVRVGELSGVVPDALLFAFEVCSKGTVADGAVLHIEEVSARGFCNVCKEEFQLEVPFLICPKCGTSDIEVLSGRELEIDNMDVENEE